MIAGTEADTARFSVEAIEKTRGPKELYWIEGASHVDLYDKDEYATPAAAKMKGFFREHLGDRARRSVWPRALADEAVVCAVSHCAKMTSAWRPG